MPIVSREASDEAARRLGRGQPRKDDVRRKRDQLRCVPAIAFAVACAPASVDAPRHLRRQGLRDLPILMLTLVRAILKDGSEDDGQRRYKDPRYAVSRPPMVTAAHNRQVAETSLRPREETAPFVSQPAASRFMVI